MEHPEPKCLGVPHLVIGREGFKCLSIVSWLFQPPAWKSSVAAASPAPRLLCEEKEHSLFPSLISFFFCNNFPTLTGGDGMSVSHTVCASDLRDNLLRLS